MAWTQQLAIWWINYFAGATVLLLVVLVAGRLIRQPVQRMAMAWSAIIGLALLAMFCALPGWPRVSLVRKTSTSPPMLVEIDSKPTTVKEYIAS